MKFSKRVRDVQNTMNSTLSGGRTNHTNQEKTKIVMKDFKFFGGRWSYGILKRNEKIETFFLLTKKNQNYF